MLPDRRKKKHKVKHTKQRRKSMEIERVRKMHCMRDRTKNVILYRIPVDLHAMFKAWCSHRGYTITGRIRQFMYDCATGKIKE